MPISHVLAVHREQPRAYLNGQFVGYGELTLVTQWTEARRWGTPAIEMVPTNIQMEGVITVLPGHASFVSGLAASQSPADFGEEGDTVKVRIVSIEYGIDTRIHLVAIPEVPKRRLETKTLCDRCCYLMRGNPSICNAFHPEVGVSECPDFEGR